MTINSEYFKNICNDLAFLGDTIIIRVTLSFIEFSIYSDSDKGSIIIYTNENTKIIAHKEENIKIAFSLKHIIQSSKGSILSNSTTLKLKENNPLEITYIFQEHNTLKYFIAPKIF